MLYINAAQEIEQLRNMSLYLKADFIEGVDSAKLEFDNQFGKGKISTFVVLPGLVVKTYDIQLLKELKFSKKETLSNPIYFIYCVKGHYFHGFQSDKNLDRISNNQNVILNSSNETDHYVIMPTNVHIKISLIFLDEKKMIEGSEMSKLKHENTFFDIFRVLDLKPGTKHLGKIDLVTSRFAEMLIDNERVDIVGKLISEGALLNTLGSQLKAYKDYEYDNNFKNTTFNSDLEKIIELGDYINKNISDNLRIEDLVRVTGLSKRKLQAGCQYLYGESVNRFIQRLRLERARMLFQTTNLTVSEVCYEIGLSSRSYFSKIFRDAFGFFPSDYRTLISNEDFIFELIYYSEAIDHITKMDIKNILESSLKNNIELDITGALVYHQKRFFQIIEGPKKNILDLYDIILTDPRHSNLKLIWKGVRKHRTFKEWSMAFISDDKITGLSTNAASSLMNIEELIDRIDDKELFADKLWRKVLSILKEVA